MDWWKLFVLLVAVASIQVTAEGSKKKIRIHLPQKVKHIHHHKKIYITNHPAQSQYAPAFLPNAEGAVAVPTNVALPAVASIVPLNSVELYEEPQNRPGVSPAASKLLPLYRARGYYGPNHSDWDEQEYDLAPPPEPADHEYVPTAFSSPAATGAASSNYPPKRVKILKVNEIPRKKVIRKVKPKRVVIRGRPQPEEEHPVSTFHEQFYSDLQGSGTIRKIKKPQRVEKIIDGDTEHIHTYSEEHIHKVVFDDGPKLTGVVGVDHVGSMSALTAAHPLIPIKNSQSLLAIPPGSYPGLAAVGSMGTPSHLEYAAYNPRDVTHDHIFHDHGEISSDIDITKDSLSSPPKVSYNSQGLRISGGAAKRQKIRYASKYPKTTKPAASSDFSYYESIFSPNSRPKKVPKPTVPTPDYESSSAEFSYDEYKPQSTYRYKDKSKLKSRYVTPTPSYFGSGKQLSDFRLQQASVPAPFSLSSTVVHDYQPKAFAGSAPAQTGFTNFKDPFVNFKGNYPNNFEYDTYASSSNVHPSDNKNDEPKKGKKKSISTQNISFGRQEHQTVVDHLEDPSGAGDLLDDDSPTSAENIEGFDDIRSTATPTTFTIRETSPAYQYYSAMAIKALHGDPMSVPEASNDNFQYAEPPTPSTTPYASSVATTTISAPRYFKIQSSDAATIPPSEYNSDSKLHKRRKERNKPMSIADSIVEPNERYTLKDFKSTTSSDRTGLPHALRHLGHRYTYDGATDSPTARGKLKYGDKI